MVINSIYVQVITLKIMSKHVSIDLELNKANENFSDSQWVAGYQ